MKYILFLFLAFSIISCEKEENDTCDCETTTMSNGEVTSVVQFELDTPADGNCENYFFSITDSNIDYSVTRICN